MLDLEMLSEGLDSFYTLSAARRPGGSEPMGAPTLPDWKGCRWESGGVFTCLHT